MQDPDDHLSIGDAGSPGYQSDSDGYPPDEIGGEPGDGAVEDPDPARFMDPKQFAKSGMISSSQPIAHRGKAGWAFELATQKAVWMQGEIQWDVLGRDVGAPRDEPGLTDIPEHGGLPKGAPGVGEVRSAASENRRRTALARILVIRGAREIVEGARDSGP